MEFELIKDKVYCKVFDLTYASSTAQYNLHKAENAASLARVQQNISSVQQNLDADKVVILKQVHGNIIFDANADFDLTKPEEADGSVTSKNRTALGILTADCVPVLLAADDGETIGAAHCGWKSAKANIIDNLYAKMQEKGANNIKAFIGPSIQQKSYEVDESYYNNFINESSQNKRFFIQSKNANRYMFDLSGYVKKKIEDANIEIAHHVKDDTYDSVEKYPSFRRCSHQNIPYNQNILSTIIMK